MSTDCGEKQGTPARLLQLQPVHKAPRRQVPHDDVSGKAEVRDLAAGQVTARFRQRQRRNAVRVALEELLRSWLQGVWPAQWRSVRRMVPWVKAHMLPCP